MLPLVAETLMVLLVPVMDVTGVVVLANNGMGRFRKCSPYVWVGNVSPICRSTLCIGSKSLLVTSIFTVKLTGLPTPTESVEGVKVKLTALTIGAGVANHNEVATANTRKVANTGLENALTLPSMLIVLSYPKTGHTYPGYNTYITRS
ncbi:hypothetical protein ACFLU0_00520 [Chloroflexota bacterium]